MKRAKQLFKERNGDSVAMSPYKLRKLKKQIMKEWEEQGFME